MTNLELLGKVIECFQQGRFEEGKKLLKSKWLKGYEGFKCPQCGFRVGLLTSLDLQVEPPVQAVMISCLWHRCGYHTGLVATEKEALHVFNLTHKLVSV